MNDSEEAFDVDARRELLLRMYDQAWNNINRHISVVWQSVSVIVAAFAIYAGVAQKMISLDIASTLLVTLCGWVITNGFDASGWYNRNLAIIANLEAEFLWAEDATCIHPYVGKHRPPGKPVTHFWIQIALAINTWLAVLGFHASESLLPDLRVDGQLQLRTTLPYVLTIFSIGIILLVRHSVTTNERKFSSQSPAGRMRSTARSRQ